MLLLSLVMVFQTNIINRYVNKTANPLWRVILLSPMISVPFLQYAGFFFLENGCPDSSYISQYSLYLAVTMWLSSVWPMIYRQNIIYHLLTWWIKISFAIFHSPFCYLDINVLGNLGSYMLQMTDLSLASAPEWLPGAEHCTTSSHPLVGVHISKKINFHCVKPSLS